jgi:hypothetical protein
MPEMKNSIERLPDVTRGDVYLLPVSRYPLHGSELTFLRKMIKSLVDEYLSADSRLSLEVLIRQSCLYTGLLDTFVDNAPQWMPQQGLAVIPHKPPPHMPSRSEIESVDPRLINQYGVAGVVDVPEFIFQITDEGAKKRCCEVMSGHGALSIAITALKTSDLQRQWKELFGSRVTDRHFRSMPLFIPLFGARSFQGATADDLSSWFETFELYIGESKEDQGIVIASREKLKGSIENLTNELSEQALEAEAEILRW